MKKLLQDDFGQIVGICEVARNTQGIVEYGKRNKDRILHIAGQARLRNPSELRGTIAADRRIGIEFTELIKWDV